MRVDYLSMIENAGYREMVGTRLSSSEKGHAVVTLDAEERHLNLNGTVHGGAISTLVDVLMAEALNTVSEEDQSPVTVEMKVNYLELGRPGTLTSTARIRKGSKRVTIVEAEVTQEEDGEILAPAIGTYTRVG